MATPVTMPMLGLTMEEGTVAEWLKRDRGGIYCATQRVDGFVSMDAADTPGTLTTRPLLFYAAAGTLWILPIGFALPWMYREP